MQGKMQVMEDGKGVARSTRHIPRSKAHAYTFYTTLANAIAVDAERFGVGAEEVAALLARVVEFHGGSLRQMRARAGISAGGEA